jgi:hypothetical protein
MEHIDARYHDAHIDDPAEWDSTTAEEVTPTPSGMSVFSLRLPSAELSALRASAAVRNVPVSELVRMAIRAYLSPGQLTFASVSFASATGAQLSASMPYWSGGRIVGELTTRTWQGDVPEPTGGATVG